MSTRVMSVDELLERRYDFPVRRKCDGTCSQCGACCDRVLMLTKKEVARIKELLKKDKKIRSQVEQINKNRPHKICPFLDFTKANHKCMIYGTDAYPVICRVYNCDQSKINGAEILKGYSRDQEMPEYVDMWHRFFGEEINIAPAWERKDILENRFQSRLPKHIMMNPDQLWRYL